MTDKHPKRPRDPKGHVWRLRHNTGKAGCLCRNESSAIGLNPGSVAFGL
jgi:hypothetical protein